MDYLPWLIFLFCVITAMGNLGLDLKKWWSWIPIVSGFILGILFAFLKNDSPNLGGGICLGLVIALLTTLFGIMMRRRSLKAKEDQKIFLKKLEKN